MKVFGIRDQRCNTWLGITMAEGQRRRSIISLLVLLRGSSRIIGLFGVPSSLRLITSLLLLHSCFMSVFRLEKLKDLTRRAQEYVVTVSTWFAVAFEDPVELWDTFKSETLKAAQELIGGPLPA